MLPRLNPFEFFTETDGSPLDGGRVYIGTVNQNPKTSPITVYFDSAMTIPAPQPLQTVGGRIVKNGAAASIYSNAASFSLLVENSKSQQVSYNAAVESDAADLRSDLALSSGASMIGFLQSGTGAIARTIQAKERDLVSVKDFGATGDGSTDDSTALNVAATAAKAAGVGLLVPAGLYVTTTPWVIPVGVPIVGVGQSWPVPGTNPTAKLYGAVIWKKHGGNGITITGGSAYDSAAPIQDITIISNKTTWPTGNGFVMDKATRCHLIYCNVWSVGGDSFVIGVTAGDVTGHNYLTRCYSNNPGGANFRIRAKWTRCDTIVSDGGTWGAVLDSAPETEIKSWHFEGYSTGCIDVTNGSTSFAATGKGFMGNTASALIGIRIKNDAGNAGARIENVYGAGGGTASSIGIDVVGASAEDAMISGCLLEGWATGVRDTSTNTHIVDNKFYNNTLPISAGGTGSMIRGNRTQNTTGGWSIDHVAGGSGIWEANNLDQAIKATSSGVNGNFGTNLVTRNKGFKTRSAGITPGVSSSPYTFPHGLSGIPSTQLVSLVGLSGATNIYMSSDATNTSIYWTGAGTFQFTWDVALTCERQF